jgi:hypothetical protein
MRAGAIVFSKIYIDCGSSLSNFVRQRQTYLPWAICNSVGQSEATPYAPKPTTPQVLKGRKRPARAVLMITSVNARSSERSGNNTTPRQGLKRIPPSGYHDLSNSLYEEVFGFLNRPHGGRSGKPGGPTIDPR